jgi:hypothetical protein
LVIERENREIGFYVGIAKAASLIKKKTAVS